MSLTRRGLLAGIFAAGIAPAYVASGILMPVRKIITPGFELLTLTDQDTSLIEMIRWTQEQITMVCRVPPKYMIVHPETARDLERMLAPHQMPPGRVTSPTRRYRLG